MPNNLTKPPYHTLIPKDNAPSSTIPLLPLVAHIIMLATLESGAAVKKIFLLWAAIVQPTAPPTT